MSSWFQIHWNEISQLIWYGLWWCVGMLIPVGVLSLVYGAYKWVKRVYK